MGEYIEERNEVYQEKHETKSSDILKGIPPLYWFGLIVILIGFWIYYKTYEVNGWYIIAAIIIIFILLRSLSVNIDTRKLHDVGEAIAIVSKEIKRQMEDSDIGYPPGKIIPTGVGKYYVVEKDGVDSYKFMRVPFNIVEDTGKINKYCALVHPYEPKVIGMEEILLVYKGTEQERIKLIIPPEQRLRYRLDRGKIW